ncbi:MULTISPECIES: ankyrin repeat domain-containing protein [Francisella]|uniref:Ankyrin repeat domain-containing protein n=1 Tax=Francisella opportunistica TaxID=2016517 RepID=A0A345JRE5_9GAMM|nr:MULTISPECIES: ankyrin repeat domain-containing protein [Francisella]APC91618.1 hypothetical protein BBG19_0882 [Francisella sp. MA067296]AXH29891.1 ankyrin repeat domain-containing protein [Francisella opportunistica]AXH31538.1 hypothetical protein CGC44_04450 [Francisella opportunistica]AXH33186.1 hypothetical protein CGC45_04475 [Francisella opportunistica]
MKNKLSKNPLTKNPYLIIFDSYKHTTACITQFNCLAKCLEVNYFDANYLEDDFLRKNFPYYDKKSADKLATQLFESFYTENEIFAVNVTIFVAPTQIVDFDMITFKKRLAEQLSNKFHHFGLNIGLKGYYNYNNERQSFFEEYDNERQRFFEQYKNHISMNLNSHLNSRFNKLNSIIVNCKNINELLYILLEEKIFLSKVIDINQEYTKFVYSLLKQIQSKFISDVEENYKGNLDYIYKKNLEDMVKKGYHTNTFLLYIASIKNHTDVVKLLLLEQGTGVNQANNNGVTPLWIACQRGHINIVKLLLLDSRIEVNQPINDGTTPFMIACQRAHINIVELLLSNSRTEANQAKNNGIKCLSNNLLLEASNSIASYFIAGCSNSSNNLILDKLKENFPTHDINTAWKMPSGELLTPLIQGCYFMCNRSINWLLDNYEGKLNKEAAFKNSNALKWYTSHKDEDGYDKEIEERLRQL